MMSKQQQIKSKSQFGKKETPTETFKLFQEVYRNAMMSRTEIFEWQRRLKEEREDVEDNSRSKRQTASRINEYFEHVREKVQSDHLTIVL